MLSCEMKEKYISLLQSLCMIETPSESKQSIDKMADFLEKFATDNGFATERFAFENAGDYLLVKLNEDLPDKPIMLMAHMDTVHEKGSFGKDIVTRDASVMHGPGVMDCKGGIATGLCVMELLKSDVSFKRPIYFLLTSDEEVNNKYSKQRGIDIITDTAKKSCAVFNLEPGMPGKITVGRKGILRMMATVTGVAAHAGNAYFDGASAIKEAAHMILEIESMSKRDGITFNCGVIDGGTVSNVVPEKCTVEVDIRAFDPEDMKQAEKQMHELMKKTVTPNTKRHVELISLRPPMKVTDETLRLLDLWNQSAKDQGKEQFEALTKGGGSDAAYTVMAGAPTLCSCAMVGYNEHTTDEKVDLSTLNERAALLCNTIKLI